MSKRIKLLFYVIGILFFSSNFVQAVKLLENGKKIIPEMISGTIKIDGDLSEKVWGNAAISKEFVTFSPGFGEVLSQDTKVWMAYDDKNLYFAFKCYDTEPHRLKTSISRRDKIGRDDWVAVVIDPMGNRQTSYEFYVNPNGIQDDGVTSGVAGWVFDITPDFVWESAGKITGEGYQVEICIPLESIRFKSGKEVEMGIIFMRNINRIGKMGSWPEIKAGQTQFNFMSTVIYKALKKRLNLEVLPNFTYSREAERENDKTWGESEITNNIGAAIKYGITSSITAEATINPDFSQVESDVFQVEVNRRYPIFFSEKRPFFMEGKDVFYFGILPPQARGSMFSAVHTRNIIDPGWAAKLSGTSGKMNFAVLAANDQAPGQPWAYGVNPYEGKDVFWGIARAKYNIGSDNSIGILYTGRHFAEGNNDVLGADLQYRLFKNARLTMSYLYSRTEESEDNQVKYGNGFNAYLRYRIPELYTWASYERYDENFTMHSAFLNRINISRGQVYIGPNFYPKKIPWIQIIRPYLHYITLHDMGTKMDDTYWKLGVNLYLAPSGAFFIEYRDEKEEWKGKMYNPKYVYSFGQIQLFKWIYVSASYMFGDKIFYGPGEPFLGTGHQLEFSFIFQPSIKLDLSLGAVHIDLYKEVDQVNQKVFDVDVLNFNTSYQFNKYFFIRGVVRYNDYQKKLLTDFLASFTLIPGTVVHIGYGSLYERKEWQNNRWVLGDGDLLNMKNGLFFKISYLWRID